MTNGRKTVKNSENLWKPRKLWEGEKPFLKCDTTVKYCENSEKRWNFLKNYEKQWKKCENLWKAVKRVGKQWKILIFLKTEKNNEKREKMLRNGKQLWKTLKSA